MIRPTSVWRSCTRKIVVFPDGISESIISSGNSTSWRMMNSRNCFTTRNLRSGGFALQGAAVCHRALFGGGRSETAAPGTTPLEAEASRALQPGRLLQPQQQELVLPPRQLAQLLPQRLLVLALRLVRWIPLRRSLAAPWSS